MFGASAFLSLFLHLVSANQNVCISPNPDGSIPECASDTRDPVFRTEAQGRCSLGDVVFIETPVWSSERRFSVLVEGSQYSRDLDEFLNHAFSIFPTRSELIQVGCDALDFDLVLEFSLMRRMDVGPFGVDEQPPRRPIMALNYARYTVAVKDGEVIYDELEDWGVPTPPIRPGEPQRPTVVGQLVRSSEYAEEHGLYNLPLRPREN